MVAVSMWKRHWLGWLRQIAVTAKKEKVGFAN
jgi:hypothetical protein